MGASTLAIINFFVAIADGTIDPQERKLMGVVYIVLRVAMVLILITTLALALIHITLTDLPYFTPFTLSIWTLIVVLYANAVLMTKHIMPSKVGPALQAATWYTLGIVLSLVSIGLFAFTYTTFLLGYAIAIIIAIAIVNSVMVLLKKK